jgi:hypothetical protein
MVPAVRVSLGMVVGVCALLIGACFFSGHWYHSAPDSPYLRGDVDWHGVFGPRETTTLARVLVMVGFVATLLAIGCGLIVALGTAAGARRDHVPRMAALLAWSGALAVSTTQAIAVLTWDLGTLPEPKGVGWAMPVFFLVGPALAIAGFLLWRDAGSRARTSAAALAKVNRELAARDLAAMPDAELEEPPVERV